METPDDRSTYKYHWAKIKTFAARGAPMQGQKMQCRIGAG
jgi:hypothetical protein